MNDICLILEGTYPYVVGGVSSWVHFLLNELKEFNFSIAYIAPNSNTPRKFQYSVPPNVKEIIEIFIHDPVAHASRKEGDKEEAWGKLKNFYEGIIRGEKIDFDEVYSTLCDPRQRELNYYDLLESKQAWELALYFYEKYCPNTSFLDFFWNIRFLHLPLLQMINAAIPKARVYHTISTGYAGLLGVIAKKRRKAPLLLTEHGIYTKERKIEINQSSWLHNENMDIFASDKTDSIQKMWISMFEVLSRLTYDYSEEIITLFEGNKKLQVEAGANEKKVSVIPNGINIKKFEQLERKTSKDKTVIAFVGRVVPIKDVKSFIRACKIVADKIDNCEFLIIGPYDEDPDYYNECQLLVDGINLGDKLVFTGNVNLIDYYSFIDILVLTSISESQPLVILEAQSVGIPVVSTDVGSCSELLYGSSPEDQKLGKSGIISPIGNTAKIADGIVQIIKNKDLYNSFAEAGRQRVNTYYTQEQLRNAYRGLYERYIN